MAEEKKLTGRPQLKEGKRSRFINARFSEEEFVLIGSLEEQLGISKTELVRMRLLSEAKTTIINARELIARLDSVGAELGRIGNNINQLARHANTLKLQGTLQPVIVEQFNRLFEEHLQAQQSLEAALRQIIRALGR
jgi:capsule polysaccharide export protein KpsE/RkpR